jgi:hypothetical protein
VKPLLEDSESVARPDLISAVLPTLAFRHALHQHVYCPVPRKEMVCGKAVVFPRT